MSDQTTFQSDQQETVTNEKLLDLSERISANVERGAIGWYQRGMDNHLLERTETGIKLRNRERNEQYSSPSDGVGNLAGAMALIQKYNGAPSVKEQVNAMLKNDPVLYVARYCFANFAHAYRKENSIPSGGVDNILFVVPLLPEQNIIDLEDSNATLKANIRSVSKPTVVAFGTISTADSVNHAGTPMFKLEFSNDEEGRKTMNDLIEALRVDPLAVFKMVYFDIFKTELPERDGVQDTSLDGPAAKVKQIWEANPETGEMQKHVL